MYGWTTDAIVRESGFESREAFARAFKTAFGVSPDRFRRKRRNEWKVPAPSRVNSVSSVGDVNGDGFDDLVVGANLADASGNSKSSAGDSSVIFGGDFTLAVTHAGTAASETLTGDAAANVMIGGRGDDLLIGNGGADVLRGGEGNDTLAVSDLTFSRIVGGNGSDTLRLDGSGLTLNLTTLADNKLASLETIDIRGSGANTLTFDVRDVLSLTAASNPSQTSNTLAVRRDSDDTINMGTGWAQGTDITLSGVLFEVFTQGAATLHVEAISVGDTVAPELTITPNGTTTNASPVLFTFQFSETVTGFAADDVSLTNGTAGTFTALDGDTYTLLVTPVADGSVSVSVAADLAQDAANNGNTSASASVTSDRTAPTVSITPNGTTTSVTPILFTFQFSETVTGFAVEDVSLTNGLAGTFTALDGDTYTLLVTPVANGLVGVNVASESAQDAAGNGNSTASATVTSDLRPSLEIDDVSVTEGHQGTTNAVFTITLRNPPGKTVEVAMATAAGTATAGSDFRSKTQILRFLPGGSTTQQFQVRVNGDRNVEPDETFFVNILYARNATVDDRQGLGTIANDDVAPSISISNASVQEGNSGTVNLVFTVSLSQPTLARVTVALTTANGSALAGRDYRALATVLTFSPGGATSQQVRVRVIPNRVAQPNRTLVVKLSNATNAIFANDQALGTILDDDP